MTRVRGLWRLRFVLLPLIRLDAVMPHTPAWCAFFDAVSDWAVSGIRVSHDGGPWLGADDL